MLLVLPLGRLTTVIDYTFILYSIPNCYRGDTMRRIIITFIILVISSNAFAFNVPIENRNVQFDIYGSVKANITGGLYLNDPGKTQISYTMNPDSFIGFNLGYRPLYLKAEFGFTDSETLQIDIRQLYAGLFLGSLGNLKIGQQFTVASVAEMYNDVFMYDQRLVGYGNTVFNSSATILYEIFGLQVALVDLFSDYNIPKSVGVTGNFLLPRVELAYSMQVNKLFSFKVFGSYANINTKLIPYIDAAGDVVNGNNLSVATNAFHVGFLTKFDFNMHAALQLSGFFSMNGELYDGVRIGGYERTIFTDLTPQNHNPNFQPIIFTAGSMINEEGDYTGLGGVTAMGGALAILGNITETIRYEFGGGGQLITGEGLAIDPDGSAGAENLTAGSLLNVGVYVNFIFDIHPNFNIGPQVGGYLRLASTAVKYPDMMAVIVGMRANATF